MGRRDSVSSAARRDAGRYHGRGRLFRCRIPACLAQWRQSGTLPPYFGHLRRAVYRSAWGHCRIPKRRTRGKRVDKDGMRKVTIIGGGGVRTPLVIHGLAQSQDLLQVRELALFDIDTRRAETI